MQEKTRLVPLLPGLNFDPYIGEDDWRVTTSDNYYQVLCSYDWAQCQGLRTITGEPTLHALIRAKSLKVKDGALIAENGKGCTTLIIAGGGWISCTVLEGVSLFDPGGDWVIEERNLKDYTNWRIDNE